MREWGRKSTARATCLAAMVMCLTVYRAGHTVKSQNLTSLSALAVTNPLPSGRTARDHRAPS